MKTKIKKDKEVKYCKAGSMFIYLVMFKNSFKYTNKITILIEKYFVIQSKGM
jgi:hypothetical protein